MSSEADLEPDSNTDEQRPAAVPTAAPVIAAAPSPEMPEQAGSPSAKAAALAGLREWKDTHCRDSAISRNTPALNTITNAVAAIEAAIATVTE